MNDPSIDNPRLLTAAGEEEHIAIEEAHDSQRRNDPSCLVVRPQDRAAGHDYPLFEAVGELVYDDETGQLAVRKTAL